MEGFTYTIQEDRLQGHGISHGYGDSRPYIVRLGKKYLIGRLPSRSDWGSRGCSTTLPAEWFIWEFIWIRQDEVIRVAQVLTEEKPGKLWRRTQAWMLKWLEENDVQT